jgi:hypothetical protein
MEMRKNYAFAVVLLVVGGALARTAVLNWIAGPLIVIASVSLPTWFTERKMRRAVRLVHARGHRHSTGDVA